MMPARQVCRHRGRSGGEGVSNTVPVRNSEYFVEAHHTYRPLSGIGVRSDIQYVIDPGGTSQNKNALESGLKTVANF